MSNDSSLGGGGMQFNLANEQGVTQLLLSIRAAEISSAQKNELRDLVFLYANGGRDESVRITLEQKITAYGVRPVAAPGTTAAKESAVESPAHPFGASRPAPAFSVATVPTSAATQPQPQAQKATTPVARPVEPAEPVSPRVEVSVVNEVVPPKQNTPPQAAPEAPRPATSAVLTQAPEPTVSPAETQTAVDATVSQNNGAFDPEQNLLRIRQIKSLVNEQVGNPVNLIDINNEVGREYMAALLDAMKKLNSGSSVTSAMLRLENAYSAVEEALANHRSEEVVTDEPAAESPKVTPPQSVQPEQATAQSTITKQTPADQPVITSPASRKEHIPSDLPVAAAPIISQKQSTEHDLSAPAISPEPPEPLESKLEPQSVATPAAEPVVSIPIQKPPVTAERDWGPAADTLKAENNDEQPAQAKISSLAVTKKKLRTPSELTDPTSLETSSVEGDPLYTREVDNGLNQLLSEWPLFKKSGLFGTGPKGREHPLFMKIAGLQIPLLLAGRFEGATQEIKQSITDYMNGWRYEQGIIYEQGENFEHYLRRVIRHILDLQNRKPLA